MIRNQESEFDRCVILFFFFGKINSLSLPTVKYAPNGPELSLLLTKSTLTVRVS